MLSCSFFVSFSHSVLGFTSLCFLLLLWSSLLPSLPLLSRLVLFHLRYFLLHTTTRGALGYRVILFSSSSPPISVNISKLLSPLRRPHISTLHCLVFAVLCLHDFAREWPRVTSFFFSSFFHAWIFFWLLVRYYQNLYKTKQNTLPKRSGHART